MSLKDYTILVLVTSLTSVGVDAFSLAIRMPSVLSKGGGRGGGGGSHGSGGSSSSGSFSSSAHTGRGSSGDTGHPAVTSFSGVGSNGRVANYYSGGGGSSFAVPASSAFAGRQMGGGTRDQVVGTPRYASGYPYSVSSAQYDRTRYGVYGQPFPFGFYPIYWGYHGYGGEYAGGEGRGAHHNASVIAERPGGNLSYVHLTSAGGLATSSFYESYWMIGDYESVNTLFSLLNDSPSMQYGCGALNSTILPFITVAADGGPLQYNVSNSTTSSSNTTDLNNGTTLPFRFENVVQWYRASSFALAYQGYNNTYAFPPLNETTSPSDWSSSSPLPSGLADAPFFHCINTTISAALPILDGEPKRGQLSIGAVLGIAFGSFVGLLLLIALGIVVWKRKQKAKLAKTDKSVPTEHEEKPTGGPIMHESERTMVEDDKPPAYWKFPLAKAAK